MKSLRYWLKMWLPGGYVCYAKSLSVIQKIIDVDDVRMRNDNLVRIDNERLRKLHKQEDVKRFDTLANLDAPKNSEQKGPKDFKRIMTFAGEDWQMPVSDPATDGDYGGQQGHAGLQRSQALIEENLAAGNLSHIRTNSGEIISIFSLMTPGYQLRHSSPGWNEAGLLNTVGHKWQQITNTGFNEISDTNNSKKDHFYYDRYGSEQKCTKSEYDQIQSEKRQYYSKVDRFSPAYTPQEFRDFRKRDYFKRFSIDLPGAETDPNIRKLLENPIPPETQSPPITLPTPTKPDQNGEVWIENPAIPPPPPPLIDEELGIYFQQNLALIRFSDDESSDTEEKVYKPISAQKPHPGQGVWGLRVINEAKIGKIEVNDVILEEDKVRVMVEGP
jgi:hypothetical protein